MNISFKEKSLWISVLVMSLVWAWYFSKIWDGLWALNLVRSEVLVLSAVVVGAIIALQVVLHIIVAIVNPKETDQRSDERDRQINRKAGNLAGWVMAIGVFHVWAVASLFDIPSIILANILLLILVLTQIVNDLLRLLFYSRGV
jgi:hypothetical protein